MTDTTQLTVAEIIEIARRDDLSNKKIRSLLYHHGHDHHVEMPAIREALGREVGESGEANRHAKLEAEAHAKAAEQGRLAEREREIEQQFAAERQARQAELMAKAAIVDGAVIWCDASENVTVTIGRYGKKLAHDNGGHRVALVCGDYVATHQNRQCPDQFAAECWAVLKAVDLAVECGLSRVTIRNDRIADWDAVRRGKSGAKYLFVACRLAEEHGLAVTFDRCSSEENLADKYARGPRKIHGGKVVY